MYFYILDLFRVVESRLRILVFSLILEITKLPILCQTKYHNSPKSRYNTNI